MKLSEDKAKIVEDAIKAGYVISEKQFSLLLFKGHETKFKYHGKIKSRYHPGPGIVIYPDGKTFDVNDEEPDHWGIQSNQEIREALDI